MTYRTLPVASGRRTLAVVARQVRAVGPVGAAAVAASVAANACVLAGPWALGLLVDAVVRGDGPRGVLVPAAVIAGAALAGGVLSALESVLLARTGETVLARLREAVMRRAMRLSEEELSRLAPGDLLSRVGDDVAETSEVVRERAPLVLTSLVLVVMALGGMAALDWRLGLAGACALPVHALALRWYLPKSAPMYARQRAQLGERAQALVGTLQGAATVDAYRLRERRTALVAERSAAARDTEVGVFGLFTRFIGAINAAEFVGLAAVLAVGFHLVAADAATVGAATAAALLFHRLFDPFGALLTTFDDVQSAGASLARIAGVLDLPEPPEPADPARPAHGGVRVRGAVHRYGEGPAVLDGVDLEVAPGERVAVVGASGAGKTTLARAVAGGLALSGGRVLVGGAPVDRVPRAELRRHVVLVSQEAHVFAGTLADNVRIADPGAGDDRVLAALEAVGARGWALGLPDGIATAVGENGVRLTADRAQLLALARLVLADPPVAVLDEASAEAGSAGARGLERAALAATEGRTALVVAHRLPQAVEADRVVVMEAGRIVESGTHGELVARGGRYADLWRAWSDDRA
ncbi:ABC transporter ATP-binding protein [Nocardiopsis chromatogenes]|uniref:ABC transporter ATP-binding protein n=1 Tax=Nocardiopsis chromatogenes TaxID=280239 RepID=UPI000348E6BB|nr:ABC transporter ATP-binding protein [Nocardiopsis chromatogenes]